MKIAAIVPVYNEEDMLPQFLDYYSPQVDTVFILDNESADKTLEIARRYPNAEVTRFSTGGEFNDWIQHGEIMRKRAECVGRFDFVLIVDCDEWIHPKKGSSIRDLLAALPPTDIHGTQGYNMMQGPDEPKYDPSKTLLSQRKWGSYSKDYSKPIIVRPESLAEFGVGRHHVWHVRKPEIDDPSLAEFRLLHYLGVDEDLWVRRRLHGRIKRIAEESKRRGLSTAYWSGNILDEKSLREQFNWPRKDPSLGLRQVLP